MNGGVSTARQARAQHRHELQTLTYVTLDQANGGIVRNLSHEGIGVQAVAAVRPRQQVRVRFELRYPRLRVETRGEVTWSTFSGQCGIRFLDLQPRVARQIDEWIFGSLLEAMYLHAGRIDSMFPDATLADSNLAASTPRAGNPGLSHVAKAAEQDDGLLISAAPLQVIELPDQPADDFLSDQGTAARPPLELDWLSQPLSGRGLVWTVNTLVVVAALLLFALIFLSVTRESPRWPVAMTAGAVIVITALYWSFFKMFGGISLGARLARMAGCDEEEDEEASRFR